MVYLQNDQHIPKEIKCNRYIDFIRIPSGLYLTAKRLFVKRNKTILALDQYKTGDKCTDTYYVSIT